MGYGEGRATPGLFLAEFSLWSAPVTPPKVQKAKAGTGRRENHPAQKIRCDLKNRKLHKPWNMRRHIYVWPEGTGGWSCWASAHCAWEAMAVQQRTHWLQRWNRTSMFKKGEEGRCSVRWWRGSSWEPCRKQGGDLWQPTWIHYRQSVADVIGLECCG